MKRIAAVLVLGLFATAIHAAVGSSITVLGPGKTSSPACASGTCDGTADSTSGTFNVSSASFIRVQVFCPVGPCVGTVTVQGRSKASSTSGSTPPFQTIISCTNPDSTTGLCSNGSTGYLNVPVMMQLNVIQSGTASGTFGAILETHVTP